jgi:nicotinate-nucleotide adenylyltransferase
MKTAIFGGTFNPVHKGHLAIGEAVLAQFDFDRILFIPAFIPPHKEFSDPGPNLRLAMLTEALSSETRFAVSDCEIARRGISYTIDTVRDLVARKIIDPLPGVILGDDLAGGFYHWRLSKELAKESKLIIVHRINKERLELDFPHEYLDNDIFPISSSEIRELIRRGHPWKNFVPESTIKIIESRRLYGL